MTVVDLRSERGFVIEFPAPEKDYSVIIEDDGKTCYAYLIKRRGIAGDVWLYNRRPTPGEPEWSSPANAPFLNPEKWTKSEKPYDLPNDGSQFSVVWGRADDRRIRSSIYLKSQLVAILLDGSKPGWSLMAARDGPLALALKG
jgi:hypothetical protein